MKDYVVFSQRLARALCKRGFELKGTRINKKRPMYNVYLFENTEELKKAISELVDGKTHQTFSE